MKQGFLGLFVFISVVNFSAADEGAYLDPPYRDRAVVGLIQSPGRDDLPAKSDVLSLLEKQTSVKSQASRGTCSIFSATALLEAMLVIQRGKPNTLNLSEEWLEYQSMRLKGSEGSSSSTNFSILRAYGSPEEALLPYVGETWAMLESSNLAMERCKNAPAEFLQHCLLGHRDARLMDQTDEELLKAGSPFFDPEFQKARAEAFKLRDENIQATQEKFYVFSTEELKRLLLAGIPVTLDTSFFYGAWNHGLATSYGIGRNMDQWAKGIVGFPEFGSVDREQSELHPAGHSVVVIGYDDNYEVTTQSKMRDGTVKEFKYKGVYYFKNSWGTQSFGTETMIEGKLAPGYGIITQKYANEYATFYRLPLGEKN